MTAIGNNNRYSQNTSDEKDALTRTASVYSMRWRDRGRTRVYLATCPPIRGPLALGRHS